MKSMVIIYRNLLKSLSFAIIYISPVLLVTGLISAFDGVDFLQLLFCVLLPFFAVYYTTKNSQKGIASAFCILVGDLVYFSLTETHFSLVYIMVASVILAYVFDKMRLSYAVLISFVSLFLFSCVIGLVNPYLYEYLKLLSGAISGRGYLFGFINNAYDIFVSNKMSELFYHTAYSKSELIGDKIYSGAIDIFNASPNSSVVASYLTGKYFVNIFLSLGVFASLIRSIREDLKPALFLSVFVSVITGDVRLLSLFILLYNPLLYVVYLLAVFAAYLLPTFIKLNIGFNSDGSLTELFRYGNSWGYFLAGGIVLSFLTYFLSRIVTSRFNLSHGRYYPKKVQKIISSLGSEDNIERVTQNNVLVLNPNLVNILSLECDIHGNKIILNPDDLELIREYF